MIIAAASAFYNRQPVDSAWEGIHCEREDGDVYITLDDPLEVIHVPAIPIKGQKTLTCKAIERKEREKDNPLYAIYTFIQLNNPRGLLRIHRISNELSCIYHTHYPCTFSQFRPKQTSLSNKNRIVSDLLEGLATLHQQKCILPDLTSEDIYCTAQFNGTAVIGGLDSAQTRSQVTHKLCSPNVLALGKILQTLFSEEKARPSVIDAMLNPDAQTRITAKQAQ
ncbi:MAG: hypothetical protein KGI83_01700, partial [Verrucomicrobiota bacterium]|nr:hypothetical protein [Verrucomicrobiota bacterium]